MQATNNALEENKQPDVVLSTIPQTIFGPRNLVKGRLSGFATDIRKLVRMSIAEYAAVAPDQQMIDDKTLWSCFKRVWSQL